MSSGWGWPSHDKDEQRRIAACYTEVDQPTGCPLCILRAENERLREALRHCTRELEYIAESDPCDQLEIHQSGEGRACIALTEQLLGPMRDWPDEPNASARAAEARGKEKNRG